MTKEYRKGAIGALLDEYEKAITELKDTIATVQDTDLVQIIDTETADEDCRSIQTILTHIVHSGYGYATSIHNIMGHDMARPAKTLHPTTKAYLNDLTGLFTFTESIFAQINDDDITVHDDSLKIISSWGQKYDIEQMMEHAIVHILRHRRQIEKFKY